jgi:hypothetical protein
MSSAGGNNQHAFPRENIQQAIKGMDTKVALRSGRSCGAPVRKSSRVASMARMDGEHINSADAGEIDEDGRIYSIERLYLLSKIPTIDYNRVKFHYAGQHIQHQDPSHRCVSQATLLSSCPVCTCA